jgi:hypothetical protein
LRIVSWKARRIASTSVAWPRSASVRSAFVRLSRRVTTIVSAPIVVRARVGPRPV